MLRKRIVTLNLDHSRLPNTTIEVIKAIGYLSLWAIEFYEKVTIYNDHNDKDIVAHFESEEEGKTLKRYVIGAIWSEKTQSYTFHS